MKRILLLLIIVLGGNALADHPSLYLTPQDIERADIQAGDRFEIPTTVTIDRAGSLLTIQATTPGTIEVGGKTCDFPAGKSSVP